MGNVEMEITKDIEVSPRQRFVQLRLLWRDKVALIAACVFFLIIVCAIGGKYFSPYNASAIDLKHTLEPPIFAGGTYAHILGTDYVGRDVLSGMISGARISLTVAGLSVLIGGMLGTLLGIFAGYRRGVFDTVIMRTCDMLLGFPTLLILIVVMVLIGSGILNLIAVLSVLEIPIVTRMARVWAVSISEEQYIEAARATGCSTLRIMLRYILPNIIWPIVTLAILDMARYVLAEATVSFLGFGVPPPNVSWGLIMAEARSYLYIAWWPVVFPGIMIAITAMSINLVANWLQAMGDPFRRYGEKR